MAALWLLIGGCFLAAVLIAQRGWLTGTLGVLVGDGLVVAAVVLMPVVINLLGALGGRPVETLWREILHKVETSGGNLDAAVQLLEAGVGAVIGTH